MAARSENAHEPGGKSHLPLVLLALAGVVVVVTIYIAGGGPAEPPPVRQADKPTEAQRVLALARPLIEGGRHAAAIDLMETYVRANDDDIEVRPLLAEALAAAGRYEQAERTIDEVIGLAPQMPAALWLKGRLVRRRGGANPMFFFRRAAESPDAGAEVWARYGLELLEAGEHESAGRYLRRARQAGIADARTLGPLGELALRAGRFAQAEQLLTEALKTARTNARLYAMLAEAQKNAGKEKQAVQTLTGALDVCPRKGVLYMQLGEALLLSDRKPEAAEAFAKAARLVPSLRAAASLKAARTYYVLGRLEKALSHVEVASAAGPHDPRIASWKKRIEDALASTSRPALEGK